MTYRAYTVRGLLLAGVWTCSVAGCGAPDRYRPSLDHRVLPPSVAKSQPAAKPLDGGVKQTRAEVQVSQPAPSPGEPAPPVTDGRIASGPLSLPEAVALAYRLQ